jgi:sucrose-6-phosphate hydrolase SacC (GH32 family)
VRQAVHQTSIKSQLLIYENKQLQAALDNEKKRRQRGKPLTIQAPSDYYGGAVFWSPTKVHDSRQHLAQKEANKLLQLQQKQEATQRRASEKAIKAAQQAEKRQEASAAKQRRIQQRELEAQQREERRISKAADLQLRTDNREAKKGKARKKKASKQSPAITASQSAVIVEQEPVEVTRGALPKATRTRRIQPPERYLA